MPKLTQRTIDQVHAVNILDICSELGLVVEHGKWCLCPFHEDHHPSMHIYHTTNTFKCFSAKCGEQGSGIDLVMRLKGMSYIDAIKWIARNNNIFVEEETSRPQNLKTSRPQNLITSSLDRTLIALRQSADSDFCRAVVASGILTADQMQRAAQRYNLGMTQSTRRSTQAGHVIFWYQDLQGNLCEGKVMRYLPDCHRDKAAKPVTISWLLKHAGLLPKTSRYSYCLFGEHLLRDEDDNKTTKEQKQQKNSEAIAIVESEKTAIIMSEKVPDVTWLATGGMQGLNEANLLVLKPLAATHRIVLFPDTDTDGSTYSHWCDIAAKVAQLGLQVAVSDVLEVRATPEQKAKKIDIADLIID